jgi:DNA-binding CsgD family transcriptional regulator
LSCLGSASGGTGRSNQEVARLLFLSAKTVEWNLTKIYRKLHVRSRAELVTKLSKG